MTTRRRRSGDFTSSLFEYNRETEKSDSNETRELNLMEVDVEKKKMINVKSNETINADTTIFQQVTALRTQVKCQQPSSENTIKTCQTPKTLKKSNPPVSPITDVLNKISKTLELKQDKNNVQPAVETCQEPSKLWSALSNFNRSLNSDKNGVQSHQKVLSRLSQEYHLSPAKFAEKLVTIIEESVMPSMMSDHKDNSGVSVHRMTQEFRKLCKFIEDESMPEWLITSDIQEEEIENQTIEFADETGFEGIERFSSTPLDKGEIEVKKFGISYKETPKSVYNFAATPNSDKFEFSTVTRKCRINDTNNSFEYWETMCNGVFLHQRVTPQKLRRSRSLPDSPVTRLNNIKSTCERQMASLDDTAITDSRVGYKHRNFPDITFSPKTIKDSKTLKNKYFSEQSEQKVCDKKLNQTNEKRQFSAKKKTPILRKNETNDEYSLNCGDDLDKSFLAQLAQRRQRCFETAKLMMEIDKNDPIISNQSDGKKTAELIAKLASPNKSLSLPGNNLDFLNTINHCMEYQDFLLKKRKSIFQLLKNPVSDSKSGNSTESKKPETPASTAKSKTPLAKVKLPRRKFFFTPGKSPQSENVKQKKEYFPQMENVLSSQSTVNAKSPRTPDTRKNLYEYVRSPIGDYIRSTDTKLLKNVRAKNNDWLLTPQPLGISNESKGNRLTPLKNVESSALKFNLSPLKKQERDENTPGQEFNFPKVDYKPSAVQMINEDCEKSKNSKDRVKNLLKSCQKKVVIRHEGRMGVASPANKNNIGLKDLMETSVQVKTIAKKTDSIRARNVR